MWIQEAQYGCEISPSGAAQGLGEQTMDWRQNPLMLKINSKEERDVHLCLFGHQ
jgi:hypothetical protein